MFLKGRLEMIGLLAVLLICGLFAWIVLSLATGTVIRNGDFQLLSRLEAGYTAQELPGYIQDNYRFTE